MLSAVAAFARSKLPWPWYFQMYSCNTNNFFLRNFTRNNVYVWRLRCMDRKTWTSYLVRLTRVTSDVRSHYRCQMRETSGKCPSNKNAMGTGKTKERDAFCGSQLVALFVHLSNGLCVCCCCLYPFSTRNCVSNFKANLLPRPIISRTSQGDGYEVSNDDNDNSDTQNKITATSCWS